MKQYKKDIIETVGIRLMYAIVINFYIILVVAMFSDHTVYVIFNHFNEALIEYVIYALLFPIMTLSLLFNHEKRSRRKKKMKKVQQRVYDMIKESKRIGLDYITTATIISHFTDLDPQDIYQAIYRLQRGSKLRRPKIKKVITEDSTVAYTIIEDEVKL